MAEKVPSGQGEHAVDREVPPAPVPRVPGGQARHAVESGEAYVPASHFTHAALPEKAEM